MDLGGESKAKEPRRVPTYFPHQISKSKVPKTHQENHQERAQKIATKNNQEQHNKTEDHVWFEDEWMVTSLCDE
jgi:hypothetical protein